MNHLHGRGIATVKHQLTLLPLPVIVPVARQVVGRRSLWQTISEGEPMLNKTYPIPTRKLSYGEQMAQEAARRAPKYLKAVKAGKGK